MKADLMDVGLYKDYLLNDKIIAPYTARVYSIMLNKFLAGNPDIDNPEDYNKFVIDHAFKKRSYCTYYALIGYVKFKFKSDAKTRNNIIEAMRKPSMALNVLRERRNLQPEQILNVIANIKKTKHQIIALIQKLTGLRAGDVLRIPIGNILVEKYKNEEILRIAAIGKRSKRHIVEIFDPVAKDVILGYIEGVPLNTLDGYYFLERSTFRSSSHDFVNIYLNNYNHYSEDLKQAMHACGIMKEEFATHDFRRGFARSVWIKYKNILTLQKVMGHNDPRTTMRYLNTEGLDMIEVHRDMQMDPDTPGVSPTPK
jgi:integrase